MVLTDQWRYHKTTIKLNWLLNGFENVNLFLARIIFLARKTWLIRLHDVVEHDFRISAAALLEQFAWPFSAVVVWHSNLIFFFIISEIEIQCRWLAENVRGLRLDEKLKNLFRFKISFSSFEPDWKAQIAVNFNKTYKLLLRAWNLSNLHILAGNFHSQLMRIPKNWLKVMKLQSI